MNTKLTPAPLNTPLVLSNGNINPIWAQWLQSLFNRVGQGVAPSNLTLAESVASVPGLVTDVTGLKASRTTDEARITALETPAGPVPLKSYLKAAVPSAASYPNAMIYVSDATGGAFAYLSNGTNWLNFATAAVLS